MTADDFKRIRVLYGETQEQFGRRLGFTGARETVERAVRRYESGQTQIVGTMAVLVDLLEVTHRKPDTGNRRKATAHFERKAQMEIGIFTELRNSGKIEPQSSAAQSDEEAWLVSIAISLKRIADYLDTLCAIDADSGKQLARIEANTRSGINP